MPSTKRYDDRATAPGRSPELVGRIKVALLRKADAVCDENPTVAARHAFAMQCINAPEQTAHRVAHFVAAVGSVALLAGNDDALDTFVSDHWDDLSGMTQP